MGNTVTKEQIDDLIEESYLLSLAEQDIRSHLKLFVDACDIVLNQRLGIHGDPRIYKLKIELLRARIFLEKKTVQVPVSSRKNGETDRRRVIVTSVMQTKRLIRRLLKTISPSLLDAVNEEENRLKQLSTFARIEGPIKKRTIAVLRVAGYIGLFMIATATYIIFLFH